MKHTVIIVCFVVSPYLVIRPHSVGDDGKQKINTGGQRGLRLHHFERVMIFLKPVPFVKCKLQAVERLSDVYTKPIRYAVVPFRARFFTDGGDETYKGLGHS